MKKIIVAAILLASVSASFADEAMNAEFRTLQKWLDGIKKSSGQELRIITDTPSEVSGFLANRKAFACERTESGTKGVYYKGWYMVK